MSAYDSVAEFALTEVEEDVGVAVTAPSPTSVALGLPAPIVSAGASVVVPNAINVALTTSLPAISAGMSVLGAAINVALGFPAPIVSAGVNVLMPAPPDIALSFAAAEMVARTRAARVQLLTA